MKIGTVVAAALVFGLLSLSLACGGGSGTQATPKATATRAPAQATPTGASTGASAEQGKQLFVSGAFPCIACHEVKGVSPVNPLAPPLTTIATVAATRKPGMSAEQYIRESIEKPGAYVVTGFAQLMPENLKDKTFTKDQFESLVAYLLTLK
ncbi:MAG: c-type cytochrome [Chloroflexi bacterium]|nr:c-type cytochrome [Chloroflexota bacterium]